MKKVIILPILMIFSVFCAFGEAQISISGNVNWETMLLNAEISLDLPSAGLRLPSGRTQGEILLSAGYLNLIRPHLLNLQVDSSSTLRDLVERGEIYLSQVNTVALGADAIPPAMKPDMRLLFSSHTISLSGLSSVLLRHSRPAPAVRSLSPVSTARYTGIIVIAAEELPVHGQRSSALPVPCLFPKIWDTDMNLIYDRNMLETRGNMVRYSSLQNIFQNNPSGLTNELQQIVGERPLRIFARGTFGINPTDLIIDRNDALLIISSEENRSLLSQGRVVFILDDSKLKYNF